MLPSRNWLKLKLMSNRNPASNLLKNLSPGTLFLL